VEKEKFFRFWKFVILLSRLDRLKPYCMSRENGKSAERIKQRIDLCKEQLKFINSFYLPLASGIIVLLFSHDTMPAEIRMGWTLAGGFGVCFLTYWKYRTTNKIKALIKEL
jgi:hypothetical protein